MYLEKSELIEGLNGLIRREKVAKAVHKTEPIALITISGPGIEEVPGVVDKIAAPLAREGINLLGIMTISNSVRIFLAWEDREEALKLVKESIT